MKQPNKAIIWRKWVDPFLPEPVNAIKYDEDEDDHSKSAKESFLKPEHFAQENNDDTTYSGPCLVGPMGVVPLAEHNSPSKTFNLWVGHTNFDITAKVMRALRVVPGVEVLKVWTRYRIWVGVGTFFQQDEVLRAIEAAVGSIGEPKQAKQSSQHINTLRKSLTSKYKHWAIIVKQNNKIDLVGNADEATVKAAVDSAKGTAKEIVTSWDNG